jgi:hypothetical protein
VRSVCHGWAASVVVLRGALNELRDATVESF